MVVAEVRSLLRGRVASGRWPGLDADEVLQEACLRFLRSDRRLDTVRDRVRWLFGIAGRVAMEMRRERRRLAATRVPLCLDTIAAGESELPKAAWPCSVALLATLPERQRLLLEQRYLEGRSVAELGMMYGVTQENVRVRLHRAILRAREAAQRPQGGDPRH